MGIDYLTDKQAIELVNKAANDNAGDVLKESDGRSRNRCSDFFNKVFNSDYSKSLFPRLQS